MIEQRNDPSSDAETEFIDANLPRLKDIRDFLIDLKAGEKK